MQDEEFKQDIRKLRKRLHKSFRCSQVFTKKETRNNLKKQRNRWPHRPETILNQAENKTLATAYKNQCSRKTTQAGRYYP